MVRRGIEWTLGDRECHVDILTEVYATKYRRVRRDEMINYLCLLGDLSLACVSRPWSE